MSLGADLSDSVYDWIASTLARTLDRKSGAVIDLQMGSRLEFMNAVIREITFPGVDASSKNPASIEIKLAPESTTSKFAASKKSLLGEIPTRGSQYQRWLLSNFRLQIDGLDCSRVKAIDALTVSPGAPSSDRFGEFRDREETYGVLDISNLAFTIDQAGADLLIAWFEDFVIHGNRHSETEKNGTLQFLAPNLSDVLFTLTFRNLGIFKLTPEKTANVQAPRLLRAEMYCDEIGLQYYKGAASGVSPGSSAGETVLKPELRGGYAQGLATMASSNLASARQAQPPASETVTNAANLGRPLKFRT